MDGDAYYGSAGKRSYSYYDNDSSDRNGRQKRRTTSNNDQTTTQSAPTSNDTEYRILCPGTKIGSVIGKGGSIIKALRQECRAKIKVEDPVPGSDDRVIYICSSGREKSRDRDSEKESLCPAQEALFRVHARIIDGVGASDEDDDEPPHPVTAKLLVHNNQIGCLLGKGGKIIEQMRRDIGAQIRIMPKEQLPSCASPTDELVQLSGDPALVRKALKAISSRLHENPPRERTQGGSLMPQGPNALPAMPTGGSLYSSGNYLSQGGSLLPPTSVGGPIMGLGHSLPPLGGYGSTGVGSAWSMSSVPPAVGGTGAHAARVEGTPEDELVIRVLCPNEKIGSMIGKGGNVIRKMREDTGAKIKVGDPIPDSDERIIQISSTEFMESPASAGIEATLQVHKRLTELLAEKDQDNKSFTARLLVPSNQIGCLLGKGGQIISEMRKMTRANIRIPPKDELPRCAGENDELVQIMGDQSVVQDALIQVLNRLRNNLFKGREVGAGGGGMLPLSGMGLSGSAPIMPSYGGRHEPGSPGRMYPLTNVGSYGAAPIGDYGSYGAAPIGDYGSYGAAPGGAGLPVSSGRGTKESRRRQR